jgi:ribosomal protein S18 acetylase RimI-like enzyme
MNIKIRRANEKDIGILSKLFHQYDLFEHSLDSRIEVSSEKKYRKEILQKFKDESDFFIVAECNSKVVGFISYTTWKQGKIIGGAIDDMFIMDGYRRSGIGKRLARYALNELKKQKCRFVKSGVRPKNINAHKFWRKQGFKIHYHSQPGYSMQKEKWPKF